MNKIFSIPQIGCDDDRLSITGPDFDGDYLVEVYEEAVHLSGSQFAALGTAIQQELIDRKAREDGAFEAACAAAFSRG